MLREIVQNNGNCANNYTHSTWYLLTFVPSTQNLCMLYFLFYLTSTKTKSERVEKPNEFAHVLR